MESRQYDMTDGSAASLAVPQESHQQHSSASSSDLAAGIKDPSSEGQQDEDEHYTPASSSTHRLPRFMRRRSSRLDEYGDVQGVEQDHHASAHGLQWAHPATPPEDHTSHQHLPLFLSRALSSLVALPFVKPVAAFVAGPPRRKARQPRLWRFPLVDNHIEKPLVRYTRFMQYPLVLWIFLLAWFLGTTFLARAAWWNASTGQDVQWLDGTSTFWQRNDQCGLDGQNCGPFTGWTASYRCPSRVADTRLLNYRAVGPEEVIFQPLVVGGGDDLGTYRADSFICAAAVHRGLFTNDRGGCLNVEAVGNYTNFLSSTHNDITSVPFASEFPFAFRFTQTSQKDCRDLRNDMLIFSTIMSAAFGVLVRATAGVFYWVSVCFGFWHITLASDPREFPPDLAGAFGSFLPTLFFCYAFYRFAFRWVLPAFNNRIFERTIWFLGPFWVFLLSNYTLDKIPIDRLTSSDIKQQAGGIAAIVVLVIVLVIIAINQVRVIRVTGWLPYYLGWYILGGLIILILSQLPGLVLRIHHYIAAMCLIPATAFPIRLSLVYQGILLGLFVNGAARWGFDSVLQTVAQVRRDAALGSDLPSFNITSLDISSPNVTWSAIPDTLINSWDGFALLVNDVLLYTGSGTNFTMPTTAPAGTWRTDIPYYLRLAYTSGGSSGDFTKAATVWLGNGTFIQPAPGPS